MSNPNDNNINDSEFSDDDFETMNLPDGDKGDDTVDFDEFPAEPATDATLPADEPDDVDAVDDSDDELETLNLPEGEPAIGAKAAAGFEEFPAQFDSEENTAETADLPDAPAAADAAPAADHEGKSITDTAVNEDDDEPAEDTGATVIDPELAGDAAEQDDFDAQTVVVDEEGEPATAQTTYFDDDPNPTGATVLDQPDIMQTINTRDLSPEEEEEFQRTIVDDDMASAASIADGIAPDSQTDLRDSGTVPGDEPGASNNTETHLVIQQRQLLETKEAEVSGTADYELLELLGEGGMGVVYAANQTSIDRQVAIKMLKAKYVEKKKQRDNFLSEAVVTGDLDHPNIVPIYDVGKNASNALFYSMKRVQGTPWRDVVDAKSLKENIEILLKVADAIAFAHSRGVVHRDLKPENIMLGEYGEVLVMDWGLALTLSSFAASRSIAATASMGCTPAYAAPELVRGPRDKIGAHSDVYLLGAILYQLVTGEPPHRGNNVLQCLAAATGNKITPTEEKGELVDIALQAMATDPEDRFVDAKDFQRSIRQYLSHSESLLLSENAAEDLQKAEQSQDYKDYQRAVFGFEEALDMWDGNAKAKDGLRRANLAYARCAQSKGDFDLGMTLLDTSDADHAKLHGELKVAKAEVDAREGRLKLQRRVLVAAAAAIFLIVSGAAVWINSARQEAVEQRTLAQKNEIEAKKQEAEAVKQKGLAVIERDKADIQRVKAEEQEQIAKKNAMLAAIERDKAKLAAEQERLAKEEERLAKNAAEKAKAAAENAEEIAIKARDDEKKANMKLASANEALETSLDAEKKAKAEEAEQRKKAETQELIAKANEKKAEYESYVASIGLAAERIAANNFKDAINILEKLKATSPEHIDWEWHRLSYLTAPKQMPVKAADMIDTVAFRPDAKAFVAGGHGDTAFIWTAANPDNRILLNHGADIASVAYSRDGKQIATAGDDGIIRIWDASANPPKVIRELKGHTDRVTDVVFAPDQSGERVSVKRPLPANWLVSTSYDGTAVLWDSATGKKLHTFRGHSYRVRAAAFSPQGNLLVTVGDDRRAVVWSLIQGDGEKSQLFQKQTEFSGHVQTSRRDGFSVRMPIYAVAFSHDGNLVATGGDDGNVRIWNPLEVEEPRIEDIISSLENANQTAVRPQDISIKGQVNELAGHTAAVHAVSFSRDDSQVLSGSDDNTMRIWDTRTGNVVKTLRGHAGWVRSCTFSPAGKTQQVLSGSHDGQVRIWNVDAYTEQISLTQSSGSESTAEPKRTVIDHDDAVFAIAFDPSNKYIVTAGRNQKARIWDARSGKLVRLLGRDKAADDQANALQEGHSFLASTVIPFDGGKKILTSALDNTSRIWDARRGTELARLDDTGTTASAAVSPDGTLIATGSNVQYNEVQDATGTTVKYRTYPVRVWRTASTLNAKGNPQPEMELEGHRERVTAVAFSPDGKFIFSGDNYGKVILWNAADGKQIGDFRGPGKTVNAVRFSADGSKLLAASDDLLVHIWNRNAEKEAQQEAIYPDSSLAHKGSVTTMAIVPGKQQLLTATGGDDRMVRLWSLESGQVVKTFDGIQSPNARQGKRPLITGISTSPDGTRAFAANSDDDVIHVIDLTAGKVIASRSGLGSIWSTAVYHTSDDGGQQTMLRLATVGGNDTRVWAVSAQNGLDDAKLETTLAPHDAVTAADFSADGKFVITGGGDSTLKMWNAADGDNVFKFPAADADGKPIHTKGITHVRFAKAAGVSQLLTASDDGAVILWKWDSQTLVATVVRRFTGHTGGVNSAVFSHDAKRVLTASSDGTARIWDITKPEAIATLKGHDGPVRCAAFAPDGKWAVTGGDDFTARIWDVATGKQIKAPLTGHTDRITAIDISATGTRILTGSLDKTAKLWDPRLDDKQAADEAAADEPAADSVKEAREILTLGGATEGHTSGITSVSFSADGLKGPIVTGSLDGTAILWLANEASTEEQKVAGK